MDLVGYMVTSPVVFYAVGALVLLVLLMWPNFVQGFREARAEDKAMTQFADAFVAEKWDFHPLAPHQGGEGKAQIFVIPQGDPTEYLVAFTLWEDGTVTVDANREAAAKIPLFLNLPPERQWACLGENEMVAESFADKPS